MEENVSHMPMQIRPLHNVTGCKRSRDKSLPRDKQIVLASNRIIIFKSEWFAPSKIINRQSKSSMRRAWGINFRSQRNKEQIITRWFLPPTSQFYRSTESFGKRSGFYKFDVKCDSRHACMRSLRPRGARLRASRDARSSIRLRKIICGANLGNRNGKNKKKIKKK